MQFSGAVHFQDAVLCLIPLMMVGGRKLPATSSKGFAFLSLTDTHESAGS